MHEQNDNYFFYTRGFDGHDRRYTDPSWLILQPRTLPGDENDSCFDDRHFEGSPYRCHLLDCCYCYCHCFRCVWIPLSKQIIKSRQIKILCWTRFMTLTEGTFKVFAVTHNVFGQDSREWRQEISLVVMTRCEEWMHLGFFLSDCLVFTSIGCLYRMTRSTTKAKKWPESLHEPTLAYSLLSPVKDNDKYNDGGNRLRVKQRIEGKKPIEEAKGYPSSSAEKEAEKEQKEKRRTEDETRGVIPSLIRQKIRRLFHLLTLGQP